MYYAYNIASEGGARLPATDVRARRAPRGPFGARVQSGVDRGQYIYIYIYI